MSALGLCDSSNNLFFSIGTNSYVYLGISKIVSFLFLYGYNKRNEYLVKNSPGGGIGVRVLLLPMYSEFFYAMLLINFAFGVFDTCKAVTTREVETIFLALQVGLFQGIYVSLAVFLMNYGAGRSVIRRSFIVGGVWSLITAVLFFYILASGLELFGFTKLKDRDDTGVPAILFLSYGALLCAGYSFLLFAPIEWLYRRPALLFYSKFNLIFMGILFILAVVLARDHESTYLKCGLGFVILIMTSLVQPFAIFHTLQIDSQYWQGLFYQEDNPLMEVWDQLDSGTATSVADNLSRLERNSSRAFPILHFGLIRLDERVPFVAGGFSRVYFGSLGKERVALKMLFAIELTPLDVSEFYREALILDTLKHETIVACKGICVMPPSLILVLEYCANGSLFEFLHQARDVLVKDENKRQIKKRTNTMSVASVGNSSTNSATTASVAVNPLQLQLPVVEVPTPRSSNHTARSIGTAASSASFHSERQTDVSRPSQVTPFDILGSSSVGGASLAMGVEANEENQLDRNSFMDEVRLDVQPSASMSLWPQKNSRRSFRMSSNSNTTASIGTNSSPNSAGHTNNTPDKCRIDSTSSFRERLASIFGQNNLFKRGTKGHGSATGTSATAIDQLTLDERLGMMLDAVGAIAHMHSLGYMHCDIKSLNFLVTTDLRLKLADMGESKLISSPPKRTLPPIPARNWAPPEVLAPNAPASSYTIKSDIFGLSLVLSEIVLLQLPFAETSHQFTPDDWYAELTEKKVRPELPDGMPTALKAIIEQAWHTDPLERPAADELLGVLRTMISERNSEVSDGSDGTRSAPFASTVYNPTLNRPRPL